MLPAVEPLSSQFSRRAIYQVAFYDVDEERLTSDFWLSSLSGEEVENLEVDLVCTHLGFNPTYPMTPVLCNNVAVSWKTGIGWRFDSACWTCFSLGFITLIGRIFFGIVKVLALISNGITPLDRYVVQNLIFSLNLLVL